MATKNPRISVVLSPSLAATIAALSRESGESASSLIRGLLEQTEPALQRMLELMRAATAAKGQIGGGVRDSLSRVVNDLEDAMALAESRTDRVLRDMVTEAETVRGRRRAAAGAAGRARGGTAPAATPGPVTRGSGTPKPKSRSPRKPAGRPS